MDNRLHPVRVTALVGLVGWIMLAACALALGAVVTHFVVGHSLGHTDLDVSRWFAARRTETWNALSSVGSYVAETITVFAVVAVALVYRGMHHLSDVLCGALIGAGCIVVGHVAMRAGEAAAAGRDDEAHEVVSPPAGRDLEEAVS